LSLLYRQRAMRRDSIRWLRAGLGDFAIVGWWWRKKTGPALLLCTSSVTKSIYKSFYSLGNWATVHIWGYSSKQKLVVRRFSRMFPDDRINQVLYRQEGSRTFRDFPRGLRNLLQSVAQICTVYI
jgi:hypothetical protein